MHHPQRQKLMYLLRRPIRSVTGSQIMALAVLMIVAYLASSANNSQSSNKSLYQGSQYWKTGVTLKVKTLYETPFSRFQLHTVKMGNSVIDDWLWFDESDNINVLVQEENGKYVVLKQTKYAINGETLAVVGGLIEKGETPLEAAKRELREELGMEAENWQDMGSYRAAANRGGGMTYTFWAQKAKPISQEETKQIRGQADLERQDLVRYTEKELVDLLLRGKFGEIKWTATVALALLNSQYGNFKF
jgi:ADP-ribose pyrophosphatase